VALCSHAVGAHGTRQYEQIATDSEHRASTHDTRDGPAIRTPPSPSGKRSQRRSPAETARLRAARHHRGVPVVERVYFTTDGHGGVDDLAPP
jgi:hypothetical protein